MVHLFLQLAVASSSLGSGGGDEAVRYRGSSTEVSVVTPAVAEAAIAIDGRMDESVWSQAALLEGFTQFEPVEGVPASQRTEVMVLVDADAIFFGIRAYDTDPAAIRATRCSLSIGGIKQTWLVYSSISRLAVCRGNRFVLS